MENFNWTQFTRKIPISASVETLYKAWTVPSEIERWFLKNATFIANDGKKRAQSSGIQKGDAYEWKWYQWDGVEKGSIVSANGTDTLQFTFAGDCQVDISLQSYEDVTIVSLSQKNIPTTDKAKADIRLGCDRGWSFYLVNLKSVYEGGLDLRNKNTNIPAMVNS
ncbi:SRPBCC family protein [Rasiella sp. SM2506]|uniref:SRPBCC family protein n=1 Tax=Rasiella sp. SM2506 TaxID=3423914 RepID=UPI003D79753A